MGIVCLAITFMYSSDLHSSPNLQEELRGFLADANSGGFGLQHFTYNNDIILKNIFNHLSATDFKGIVVRHGLVVGQCSMLLI